MWCLENKHYEELKRECNEIILKYGSTYKDSMDKSYCHGILDLLKKMTYQRNAGLSSKDIPHCSGCGVDIIMNKSGEFEGRFEIDPCHECIEFYVKTKK